MTKGKAAGRAGGPTLTREMGISHADLFRLLPVALGRSDYEFTEDTITVYYTGCSVHIRISQQRERRLGALVLPVTTLEFNFDGFSEDAVVRFINRFERCYHRGGG